MYKLLKKKKKNINKAQTPQIKGTPKKQNMKKNTNSWNIGNAKNAKCEKQGSSFWSGCLWAIFPALCLDPTAEEPCALLSAARPDHAPSLGAGGGCGEWLPTRGQKRGWFTCLVGETRGVHFFAGRKKGGSLWFHFSFWAIRRKPSTWALKIPFTCCPTFWGDFPSPWVV